MSSYLLNFNIATETDALEKEKGQYVLNFTAITNAPIAETTYSGKNIKLIVDLESTNFQATKLYKDHNLSVDNVIGKIIDHKFITLENGHKAVRIKTQFFPTVQSSMETFNKYEAGLLDSVSIGLRDITSEFNKEEGTVTYKNGTIYEVSAVYEGRDPNAKLIERFSKDVANEYTNIPVNEAPTMVSIQTPVTPAPAIDTANFVTKDDMNGFMSNIKDLIKKRT